jgi:heme exporter protein B
MTYLRDAAALARKDLLLELRGRETVPAMVLFVLAVFVAFRCALPADQEEAAGGLLWVAIVLTALLGLVRAFVPEQEQRTLDALVLAPCDRSAIWLGKVLSLLAFLLVAEAAAVPLFGVFFERPSAATVGAILLADVGLAAIGTLMAAMAVGARGREVLLPLLFLPLAIPVVIGGVGATVSGDPARYLGFLALYDAIFAILAWATFEYVVTE